MASSIPTINVSDYIARKSFDVWFVGKVQRVLNKQGKIRALLVDGSKVELDKNEYEYLGAKLPAKVTSPLTEEEFKAFKKGKAKEFLSSPAPAPAPAPASELQDIPDRPSMTPAYRKQLEETTEYLVNMEREYRLEREGDPLAKLGKLPHIPIPGSLASAYKTLHHAAHHLDKVHKQAAMIWFKQFWHWANKAKFDGLLPLPNEFVLLREEHGNTLRLRGRWWGGGRRRIEISPRLFYAPIDVATEIMLHEMCHQAVTDVDKAEARDEGGHGIEWKTWMRRVGLNPARYDDRENRTYMSKKEVSIPWVELLRAQGWEGFAPGKYSPGEGFHLFVNYYSRLLEPTPPCKYFTPVVYTGKVEKQGEVYQQFMLQSGQLIAVPDDSRRNFDGQLMEVKSVRTLN